ncbi:hypothetical protein C8J57DRAFT_1238713 [Mycena rebaudengoi]|nr:hypothetical protein C8J57DRAFT_1238713 [Mycena rebaudengoi]
MANFVNWRFGSILVCQVAFLAAARVLGISTRHLTSLNSDIVDAQDLVLQIVTASHSNVYLRYSALQRGSRAPFAVGLYFPSVPIPGPELYFLAFAASNPFKAAQYHLYKCLEGVLNIHLVDLRPSLGTSSPLQDRMKTSTWWSYVYHHEALVGVLDNWDKPSGSSYYLLFTLIQVLADGDRALCMLCMDLKSSSSSFNILNSKVPCTSRRRPKASIISTERSYFTQATRREAPISPRPRSYARSIPAAFVEHLSWCQTEIKVRSVSSSTCLQLRSLAALQEKRSLTKQLQGAKRMEILRALPAKLCTASGECSSCARARTRALAASRRGRSFPSVAAAPVRVDTGGARDLRRSARGAKHHDTAWGEACSPAGASKSRAQCCVPRAICLPCPLASPSFAHHIPRMRLSRRADGAKLKHAVASHPVWCRTTRDRAADVRPVCDFAGVGAYAAARGNAARLGRGDEARRNEGGGKAAISNCTWDGRTPEAKRGHLPAEGVRVGKKAATAHPTRVLATRRTHTQSAADNGGDSARCEARREIARTVAGAAIRGSWQGEGGLVWYK